MVMSIIGSHERNWFLLTKIKQERIKSGPFFDFLLHFSICFIEFFGIASQLSCEAMFILIGPFLLNL